VRISFKLLGTVAFGLLATLLFPTATRGAVNVAGELVVDLRVMDLAPGATTWTNRDLTGNTVGNFTAVAGGALNVASVGGVTKSLYVPGAAAQSIKSALTTPAVLEGNNTRSVEAWIYAASTPAGATVVAWGNSGNHQMSSFRYDDASNGMFSGWFNDAGWGATTLPLGAWTHVVWTYDGSAMRGYVNGVLKSTATLADALATIDANVCVGAGRNGTVDAFDGYIADVRVHTGVLSAADVTNNYSQGIYFTPPSVTGLVNQTVVAGTNLVLNPVITGFPMPTLQWRSNNVALAGATNATLTLNNVSYSLNGTVYSLVATSLAGAATNGMMLTVVVTPSISGLFNQAVPTGSTVTMAPTVSGQPAPTLQWLHNGILSDGPTGNGSIIAGSLSSTLAITNAQNADSGVYSLVASNSAGAVTNSMTLTVSSNDVPPEIVGPTDQTIVQGSNATFSASVSGLPLPTLQWRVNGVDVPGANNSSLVISNVQYSQNGFGYSLVASNTAGLATNGATLYVLVPPAISQQPTNLAVVAGSPALFSVTASGVPAAKYQWRKNGSPIVNATNATYSVASPSGADNGAVFSVVVSNSVGTVVSSNATLTVLSAMAGVFLPTNNTTGIAPDQQLRIVFPGAIKLGSAGTITVRDAANNSVVATIDRSQFLSYVPGNTSIQVIPNAAIRPVQGASYYYMPIAIYGNEAWITFSNRFAYSKTYYVNMDAGLLLDTNNASIAGVSGSNTWRFSTKASGPATPTTSTGLTTITVGQDGTGDFATFQGAFDWIPQNNTLMRTIRAKPGLYRDNATLAQNRNFVTIVGDGASRTNAQLIYPFAFFAPPNSVFTAGSLRIESSDVSVLNLTLDNIIYQEYHPTGEPSSGAAGAFAGAINTLATKGRRIVFENVLIKGGQDTIYHDSSTGVVYFHDCEVWGSVDYIYGNSLAVYDQCDIVQIRSSGGPITAPNTVYGQPYGFVFLGCAFPRALVANGYPYNVNTGSTTFQRPWGQDGATAIINSSVGSQFSTKGWGEWDGRETTCRARELGTTLIGGGSVTPAQRQAAGAYWLNTIDPDYTNNPSLAPTSPLVYGSPGTNNRVAVIVDTNAYTLDAIFGHAYFNLGSWRPSVTPVITGQPTNQTVSAGSPASFSVTAAGLPEPAYQWRKAGTNIVGATNAIFSIPSARLADNGAYSVVVSSSAGSVISIDAVLTVPAEAVYISAMLSNGVLSLAWPASQTGYRLQAQTNAPSVGLTTNWHVIAGSATTNAVSVPVDPAKGSVFLRLLYP
jgi:pectin methylesterase-like acyl-CoA thioesterase